MSKFESAIDQLERNPKKWLITGVAGFIGSNILETLLKINQTVIGIDNFSTGHKKNLDNVKVNLDKNLWRNFQFIEGDIKDFSICNRACENINYVLHQAALGSVPRSIENPIATNSSNIEGFLNILVASKNSNVESFTYAASSSTYGDHTDLPKVEDTIGKPLSPYAVTKYVNELYADVFSRVYGFKSIGLRYFNVFGKYQDPNGAYAAVIPKWILSMLNNEDVIIYGDGSTSRDFCFIENVVQANILSATAKNDAKNQVYNIAFGDRTTLNKLFDLLRHSLNKNRRVYNKKPIFKDFRPGDVLHSQADISKAKTLLGYNPDFNISEGINKAIPWFIKLYAKENQ